MHLLYIVRRNYAYRAYSAVCVKQNVLLRELRRLYSVVVQLFGLSVIYLIERVRRYSESFSAKNIRITEYGDLNEIYRRTYNDTTLYKPIKGNWYIELDHSI